MIINKKIKELNNTFRLSEIYDNFVENLKPIILDVILIEKKNNRMNNLSYMFSGISTLMDSSNFNDFDSSNITKMDSMFFECSSITKLPDISNLNIFNVTDMNHMFYNCSSLKYYTYGRII